MNNEFGSKLRELRVTKGMQLRKAAAALDIDQSLLSKFERGTRLPNESFINRVARHFQYDETELLALWLSDKLLSQVGSYAIAGKALRIAEQRIRFSAKSRE
jgi:transcriptional regulator with XRE-family HTH domain